MAQWLNEGQQKSWSVPAGLNVCWLQRCQTHSHIYISFCKSPKCADVSKVYRDAWETDESVFSLTCAQDWKSLIWWELGEKTPSCESKQDKWAYKKLDKSVETWKSASHSIPRHFKPLAFVGNTTSTTPLRAPPLRDSINICWLRDWLIGWSAACGVNWLIDHVAVGAAFIWSPGEQSSGGPHSSVMSNTQGKMREGWRAVGSLPRHGGAWMEGAKKSKKGTGRQAERTKGTWGQRSWA